MRKTIAEDNNIDISDEITYIDTIILELFEFDERLDRIKEIYITNTKPLD